MVEAMSPVGKLNMLQIEKWLGTLDMREKRGTLRAMQHWADLFTAEYDVGKEVASNFAARKGESEGAKARREDIRKSLTYSPQRLAKLLDSDEGRGEKALKQIDSDLAFLLGGLRGDILGTLAIEGMDKGGMTDILLTTPGVIESDVDRSLKKSGVE
jgi:hypothetical protein